MKPAIRSGRIILPLILLTMLGVALAPLSTRSPGTGTTDADGFRTFLEPRLAVLLESATRVEGMVSERSRNILALRAESERIESIVSDIDTYLQEHDVPTWGEPVIEHYRNGSELVLRAIDSAYAAIGSFDFSAMPSMIPVFSEGRSEIDLALRALRDHSGAGSSYTGWGVT